MRSSVHRTSFRINYWGQYFISVGFLLLFPLVPLGLEWLFTSQVAAKSLTLASSMYALRIGSASRRLPFFVFAVFISIAQFTAFGYVVAMDVIRNINPEAVPATSGKLIALCYGCISLIFIIHAIERYRRHVIERAPFLDFI